MERLWLGVTHVEEGASEGNEPDQRDDDGKGSNDNCVDGALVRTKAGVMVLVEEVGGDAQADLGKLSAS